MTTSNVLDLICVVLIGVSALMAFFKGFVKTVLGLLAVLVSSVLASMATDHFASSVCEQIVYPIINGGIGHYIPNGIGNEAVSAFSSLFGGMEEKVMESVGGVIGDMTLKIADAAGKQITQPLAESLTRVVLFILFFLLFSILCRIIIFIVDAVCHLPALKMLNRLAGLGVGIAQGAVLAGLFCIALSFLVMTYRNSPKPLVTDADIADTAVTCYIYESPLIQPFLFE